MADSITQDTPSNNRHAIEYYWPMYELLVEELRHLHTVWMDNFKVILSFNSILLPGAFAVFAIILGGSLPLKPTQSQLPIWLILVLCLVGMSTSVIMVLIIQRIKAYTVLRQREARELEKQMANLLPIHPLIEGYIFGGGSISYPKQQLLLDIKPIRQSWFDSRIGYTFISFGFIVAYLLLGAGAVIYWAYMP